MILFHTQKKKQKFDFIFWLLFSFSGPLELLPSRFMIFIPPFSWFQSPAIIYTFRLYSQSNCIANRCVICQMTYRRGDQQMKLPCSHVYHGECITKWLSINKVYIFKSIFFFWSSLEYVFIFCCPHLPSFQKCPVCNTEVFGEESTH